jgi:hypothetical protein
MLELERRMIVYIHMIKEVREDYTDKGRYDTGCEIPPSPRESLAFGRILLYYNN